MQIKKPEQNTKRSKEYKERKNIEYRIFCNSIYF